MRNIVDEKMRRSGFYFLRSAPLPLLCLFLILLPFVAPGQEWRAFWADAFHDGFRTPEQVTKLVSDMRAANCNAVVVEVRKRGDAYYRSNFEPMATDILPAGYDPLQDLITQAHDTNAGPRIEVHAWLVTYLIWNKRTIPPTQPDHPYNLHPDWLTQDPAGNTWIGDTTGNYAFDPGHPAVQQFTFNVALDIVTNYAVDGINFDYIRYPETSASANNNPWGYHPVAVQRYQTLTGNPIPSPTTPEWLQWRREQVTALLRKVYLHTIDFRPEVKVSADTITWAPGVTTDQEFVASSGAYVRVLQDWRAWMEEGILDLNIMMSYFRQPTHPTDYAKWIEFGKDHRYERHVAIGPGLYLNSISNGLHQMRMTRNTTSLGNRADGVSGYSYAVPASNGIPNLQSNFFWALTQPSIYDPITPPIFDAPATVPVMPWKVAPTHGHLKGYVLEAGTDAAFDGIRVSLSGPATKTLVADGTGFFGAVDLPPGDYTLSVSTNGYESAVTNLSITAGIVTTRNFHLAIRRAPVIVSHPQSQTVEIGGTASFNVEVSSPSPYGICWIKDGVCLPASDTLTLTLTRVDLSHGGTYVALVTNAWGSVVSSNAVLQVVLPFANLMVTPGGQSALVSWTTPIPTTSQVEYYRESEPPALSLFDATFSVNHLVLLSGLAPNSRYTLRALSRDAGEEFQSEQVYFDTAGEIIIDNVNATFTGAWTAADSSGDKFLTNYSFASTVSGEATKTASYTPLITVPGLYDVYIWYPQGGNRSASAPHNIIYSGGRSLVLVNQQNNGGSWRMIAAGKPFAAGTSGSIQIANNTGESGKVVMADGVRLVYSAGQEMPTGTNLPEWWKQFYFGSTAVNAQSDGDGDGYPNWAEYWLGTNPTNHQSRFSMRIERTAEVEAVFSPYLADRIYRLQSLSTLQGAWQTISNAGAHTLPSGEGAFTIQPGAGQSYYRIQVDWAR